jgi:hypothetical protein
MSRSLLALPHRALVGALTLALAAPLTSSAQTRVALSEFDNVADPRSRATLLATVREADERGIPVEPLYEKIREGLAKESSPDRIATAVQQLSKRLAAAQLALAPSRSPREISAGADALQSGASTASLKQLRRARPVQSLVVPLGVVAEMVAFGVPAARASARVRELMERGATNAQLVELGVNVQRDIAGGLSPGTAFDTHARGTMSLLARGPTSLFTPPGGLVTYRPR